MARNKIVSLIFITAALGMPLPATAASTASADSTSANYNLLVASGYLCDAANLGSCPAVAQAANGDSIALSGVGTLNLSSKTVNAMGAFTHKRSNGEIVETGIWKATELLKFNSYGIAPGALLRDKRQPRPLGFSPMTLLNGPLPTGGLALLRIQLLPDAGKPKDAILQVNCALGKVPENQQGDGVRLAMQEGGLKFDQKISGRTMFTLMKPQSSLAPKAATPDGF